MAPSLFLLSHTPSSHPAIPTPIPARTFFSSLNASRDSDPWNRPNQQPPSLETAPATARQITSFHAALTTCDAALIALLLEDSRTDTAVLTSRGENCWHLCCERGAPPPAVQELLLSRIADARALCATPDHKGILPLQRALALMLPGTAQFVQFLIGQGGQAALDVKCGPSLLALAIFAHPCNWVDPVTPPTTDHHSEGFEALAATMPPPAIMAAMQASAASVHQLEEFTASLPSLMSARTEAVAQFLRRLSARTTGPAEPSERFKALTALLDAGCNVKEVFSEILLHDTGMHRVSEVTNVAPAPALHHAIMKFDVQLCQLFLSRGADPCDGAFDRLCSVRAVAEDHGLLATIMTLGELLLAHGLAAQVRSDNALALRCLLAASRDGGIPPLVTAILELNPQFTEHGGLFPLHNALYATSGPYNWEIVDLLLAFKADLNDANHGGGLHLLEKVPKGSTAIEELVRRGLKVPEGWAAPLTAVGQGPNPCGRCFAWYRCSFSRDSTN
jgi:hypothetical protein